MKKFIVLLVIVWMTVPASAQFAIKGGWSRIQNETARYVVSTQYYQDLMAIGSDVVIPANKCEEISVSGRFGLNLGEDWIRFVADLVGTYERRSLRGGFGGEVNLRLLGPLGVFARYSKTYPISSHNNNCSLVRWDHGRNEIYFGILVDIGDSYY